MKNRNCNLELTLLPSTTFQMMMEMGSGSPQEQQQQQQQQQQKQQQQQQLTIFYNGRVCVCEVTELQAEAIIKSASGDLVETKTPTGRDGGMVSPSLQSQKYSPTPLSMKRSLRSFLQKRKNRIEATSPHAH